MTPVNSFYPPVDYSRNQFMKKLNSKEFCSEEAYKKAQFAQDEAWKELNYKLNTKTYGTSIEIEMDDFDNPAIGLPFAQAGAANNSTQLIKTEEKIVFDPKRGCAEEYNFSITDNEGRSVAYLSNPDTGKAIKVLQSKRLGEISKYFINLPKE